jgi:ATP-dependent protease HslVU (ClpYQ) ATPase subunit
MNNIEEEYEKQMTPKKIKEELDKVIIGQDVLKRAVAVSLSNINLIPRRTIQKTFTPPIKRQRIHSLT